MRQRSSSKIGLFGGTFDPIHNGHVKIAQIVKKKLALNKIIFIPAGIMPHKTQSVASVKERLEMVRLALRDREDFVVSDYEVRKKTPAYTIETVKYWKKKLPINTRLFFIIGLDAFKEIKTWRKWQELFSLCHFIVINRPGYKKPELEKCFSVAVSYLSIPGLKISATQIRQALREGKTQRVRYTLIPEVYEYIHRKEIYSS